MKRYTYFLILPFCTVLTCLSRPVEAQTSQPVPSTQTTEDSVKTAVNRLFSAMKNADGDELKASFTDSAILQTIYTDKDGKTGVHNYPVADFAATVSRLPNGSADERIQFDIVKVDGPLAIVWAPYRFYYNGKLTHCGIDSFQLMRVGGVWKILYIVDTRRKDCE